ncbi:cytochrome P450 [Streptomyces sp. NBRC 110611]|uniref:hypothetical protein n=1 Tax=Streptomyces sp. NBRC 110611 TaxID=1621259 RepID=UPI0008346122|nr:hypothetical protein [Streptomyces sp. NBRC 110611]GAU65940.1 cytochrome P450 [Streptomyces sp. NBRC 110611]
MPHSSGINITLDAPEHTRLRTLLLKALSKSRIDEQRPTVHAAADDLLSSAMNAGPGRDIVADYAQQIVVLPLSDLLGGPASDRHHPRNVYLRESWILPPLDDWLGKVFCRTASTTSSTSWQPEQPPHRTPPRPKPPARGSPTVMPSSPPTAPRSKPVPPLP